MKLNLLDWIGSRTRTEKPAPAIFDDGMNVNIDWDNLVMTDEMVKSWADNMNLSFKDLSEIDAEIQQRFPNLSPDDRCTLSCLGYNKGLKRGLSVSLRKNKK